MCKRVCSRTSAYGHSCSPHIETSILLFIRREGQWCRYRSVVERVLGTRLVYARPAMSRAVSFEFMNRQLVWQEFSVRCSIRDAPQGMHH